MGQDEPFAGVPEVLPRSVAELGPLIDWLRGGLTTDRRLDFPAGTALPDGRLDLCKQALGPEGAALIAEALRSSAGESPSPVRQLLLGTDGLGDEGAATVAEKTVGAGVETLYLGCNGITAGGACRIADSLRASEHLVGGVWLKRNPLGTGGGQAAAELIAAASALRTLDLVQTGLDPAGLAVLAEALLTAAAAGRHIERIFIGGNPLGPAGAAPLAALIAGGAVGELYVSAAQLGDRGALLLVDALRRAPYGRLARLSVASNGIGPQAGARLVAAAADAGVELLDLGRVRAARTLGADDNHIDTHAATAIGEALAAHEHRLTHLVLAHTGMRSREAHRILDAAPRAATATRFVLGKGIATTVRRRLDALSAHLPMPAVAADVAAVRSVHRTAPPDPE
ncbi:ribonuclease inhibitor [Streptomyces sp. NBC_01142]|uniref:ribonuclease inhibitor n=1 Tax=Streptomyces sp. NBC_01142 TaxID=2975865 RepID=UPI0022551436|nr:ribonuclease inhibitor [Streptomyces sp. NBC_01142]MCX4820627.1 ribonuclease inhibitor [Streptomyces sp. NBC_01142]